MSSFKSLLLIFAVAVSSSNAFVVSSSRPRFIRKDTLATTTPMTQSITEPSSQVTSTMLYSSKTQLQFRRQDDDEYLYTDTTIAAGAAALNPTVAAPSKIFLPQASQDFAQRKKVEELMDAEMVLGRLAMVAAIVMFSNEVVSGTSLPEQIASFLN